VKIRITSLEELAVYWDRIPPTQRQVIWDKILNDAKRIHEAFEADMEKLK
jgi:hypothetical protein